MRRRAALVAVLFVGAAPAHALPPGWSTSAPMQTSRFDYTATLLPSGHVLVAGGKAGPPTLGSTELFDPASATWSPGPGMKERSGQTATTLKDGRVLLVQGDPYHYISAELFNPATLSFSSVPDMPELRRRHTATLLPDGNVLVAGGGVRAYQVYATATNTWRSPKDAPATITGGTATLLTTGKVLLAGGTVGGTTTTATWLYDPVTDTFAPGKPMSVPRDGHTSTPLGDGRVLVVGGSGTTAEVYTPSTGNWAPTGGTGVAYSGHSAVRLTDGRVFVVGAKLTEIYDPAAGHWSSAGALTYTHSTPAATLLADGTVLLPGGNGEWGGTGAAAERWVPTTALAVPGSAAFGTQLVGGAGEASDVAVTNSGSSPLLVDAATVDGDFAIAADHCTGATVAPGASCAVAVRFVPSLPGTRSGTLHVRANTAQRTHAVGLQGEGTVPPARTPDPTPTATPVPTATATPTPPPKPKPVVEIDFSSRYSPSGVSRAKACKGKVSLQLRRGRTVLARVNTRLDKRCRYAVTFSLKRTKLGTAKSLTVHARFHGNRYLGATTNRFKVKVPATR